MKPITLKQLLNKKVKPTDWKEVIMRRIRMNVEGYDISEEAWGFVSEGVGEALSEFGVKLSDKLIRDLKKNNKKIKRKSSRTVES